MAAVTGPALVDTRGRPIRDLRISITDRCNFRCTYCMPKEVFNREYRFLDRSELLTFEEIVRIVRVASELGVSKVRLTGGEPLLRRSVEQLVASLAVIDGIDDLTLTTNGSLLERKAAGLAAAGLDRVTVSLDSLDNEVFKAMNDVDFPVEKVLEGIEAAAEAGLGPIKVNMVVKKGVNDTDVLAMAEHFKGSGHILRFIEFMDVGITNGWQLQDVVPATAMRDTIDRTHPIEPIEARYQGEVATRYRYRDGSGEIGIISSVSKPFCGDCTRARISAEGRLYTCLFASTGKDLRPVVRSGSDDEPIRDLLSSVWSARDDRYSELRSEATIDFPKVEMSYIGG